MLAVPYIGSGGREDLLRTNFRSTSALKSPESRDARDRPSPGPHKVLRPDLRLAEDERRVSASPSLKPRYARRPLLPSSATPRTDRQAACKTGVRSLAMIRPGGPGDRNRSPGKPGWKRDDRHKPRVCLRESICSSRSPLPEHRKRPLFYDALLLDSRVPPVHPGFQAHRIRSLTQRRARSARLLIPRHPPRRIKENLFR